MEGNTIEEYSDEKLVVPPKTLDELVRELHKIFANDRVNVEYVKALLSSYRSNPKDWKKFAKMDPHRCVCHLEFTGFTAVTLWIHCVYFDNVYCTAKHECIK